MTVLKNSIVSVFPYGAIALDGLPLKANRCFPVTARLPGPSNVLCTHATDDQFTFQAIPAQHLLPRRPDRL